MSASGDSPGDTPSQPTGWLVATLAFTAFVNTASAVGLTPFLPAIAAVLVWLSRPGPAPAPAPAYPPG